MQELSSAAHAAVTTFNNILNRAAVILRAPRFSLSWYELDRDYADPVGSISFAPHCSA